MPRCRTMCVLHPFLLQRAAEQNPPLSASTAVNSCRTERRSRMPNFNGGPSVWPAGCFHSGFIHSTMIRRIRAVTDSNKPAHGLLNMLTEVRRESQSAAWSLKERREEDKECVQVGLEGGLFGDRSCRYQSSWCCLPFL